MPARGSAVPPAAVSGPTAFSMLQDTETGPPLEKRLEIGASWTESGRTMGGPEAQAGGPTFFEGDFL